jgi:hypothetical protein
MPATQTTFVGRPVGGYVPPIRWTVRFVAEDIECPYHVELEHAGWTCPPLRKKDHRRAIEVCRALNRIYRQRSE